VQVLLTSLEIEKSILIRMTGCPNGCARPYMAEIGLVGSGVESYQLWLGGTPGLTTLARPFLEKLPLDDLEATLEPLLRTWKQEAGPRTSLGDWVNKQGDARIQALLVQP